MSPVTPRTTNWTGTQDHRGDNVGLPPEDQMDLFIWGSGFGLPSIDPECIQAMAYIRFCGAPVTIIESDNPWNSPKGTLPLLQHQTRTLDTADEIINYLRSKHFNCDYGLTSKDQSDIIAFSSFVKESLYPVLQYLCWVLDSNYNSLIRPCYGQRLPWFYKMWYPDRRLKDKAVKLINTLYPDTKITQDCAEPLLLYKAQECIKLLSDKLGTNDFFQTPHSPCHLDAVIFAHLAPFLKLPLPHCPVKEFIRTTPNLERYIARITQRYFATMRGPIGESLQHSQSSNTTFGRDGRPTESDPHSEEVLFPMGQKIFAISIGLCAMFLYAYKIGIVEVLPIPAIDEDGDDEDSGEWE